MKPFSTRSKAVKSCSNHEIHVSFEHKFWLNPSTSLVSRNKMTAVEEAPWSSVRFTLLMLFSRDFK